MRSFIFVTNEGYTFQPNSESDLPNVENMQVIGFAQGIDAESAFSQLLLDEPWFMETSFNQVRCIELAHVDYESHIKTISIDRAKNEKVK